MDDDLLARADDLNHRIEVQAPSLNDLMAYSAKSRKLTTIALVLSIVMALTVVALSLVVLQVRANSQTCGKFNEFKAGEAELWQSIFDIPPRPDQTAQDKVDAAAIKKIVDRIFAPTDCAVAP